MIKAAYNRAVRPLLPRTYGTYNGITLRRPKLLDRTRRFPDAEAGLATAINRTVGPGDTVVIVGGGWGCSTVTAARAVGDDGEVIAYEAGYGQSKDLRENLRLNMVDDIASAHHAIVGEPGRVYGSSGMATEIHAGSLPPSDHLILDCEGAESKILEQYTNTPDTITVEVHPRFGVDPGRIRQALQRMGYAIVDTDVAADADGCDDLVWLAAEGEGVVP